MIAKFARLEFGLYTSSSTVTLKSTNLFALAQSISIEGIPGHVIIGKNKFLCVMANI